MASSGDQSNSYVNLEALKEAGAKEQLNILDSHNGTKALVIDPSLSGPLGLIIGVKLMKDHGVTEFYLLNSGTLQTNCEHVIYLFRPTLPQTKLMIQQIQGKGTGHNAPKYTAYMVPGSSLLCRELQQDAGQENHVRVGEYQLDLIPIDSNVCSLELGNSFQELFVSKSLKCLPVVVKSLLRLQVLYGNIPIIRGKGVVAHRVAEQLHNTNNELGIKMKDNFNASLIESVFLFDRVNDLASVLMPQMTYEGLADEVFQIKNNCIELEISAAEAHKQAVQAAQASQKPAPPAPAWDAPAVKKKILLNSNDAVFKDIRGLPFAILGTILHHRAKAIKSIYDERDASMSVEEMHQYWGKFKLAHKEHLALPHHFSIAEQISTLLKQRDNARFMELCHNVLENTNLSEVEAFVDSQLYLNVKYEWIYRIIVLLGITGQLSAKKMDSWVRLQVHSRGFEEMGRLFKLQQMGVCSQRFESVKGGNWDKIRKICKLTVPLGEDVDPSSFHALYHHYQPLSCRLVELGATAIRKGEPFSLLPGPSFEYSQAVNSSTADITGIPPLSSVTSSNSNLFTTNNNNNQPTTPSASSEDRKTEKPICLLYFLGGVTYSEMAAIRVLSEKSSHKYRYIIATTHMTNGKSFIEDQEPLVNNRRD